MIINKVLQNKGNKDKKLHIMMVDRNGTKIGRVITMTIVCPNG